jgi:hypothetical protein
LADPGPRTGYFADECLHFGNPMTGESGEERRSSC